MASPENLIFRLFVLQIVVFDESLFLAIFTYPACLNNWLHLFYLKMRFIRLFYEYSYLLFVLNYYEQDNILIYLRYFCHE